MSDYQKDREKIANMASEILKMENSYDSSMRGVYLDQVVGQYISLLLPEIVEQLEFIDYHQKEDYQSYGDIDSSVTKLKVNNIKGPYPTLYNYSATGILLRDIFSDNDFIIVKLQGEHKELSRLSETHYHVRKIKLSNKELKYIDFKKHIPYGDIRDEGYVLSFKSYRDELSLVDNRGMIDNYRKFDQFKFVLKQPYREIKDILEDAEIRNKEV